MAEIKTIRASATTGVDVYCIVERVNPGEVDDGYLLNNADGSFSTGINNRYTVFWNVAVDHPIPNVKTVRVHVQDSRQEIAPVTFTFIRADVI